MTTQLSSEAGLSRVWQPLEVGPVRMKNRVLVPARTLNYGENGVLSDRHLALFEELSAGGPALIVTEQHAAYEVAKGSFVNPVSAWMHSAVPRFEAMAARLRPYDVRGFVQLFGPGAHDKGTILMDDWHTLWGVSEIPSLVHFEQPMVMDESHIAALIKGFARSAVNVRDGGLDGVELHAAHTYLLGQFLSRSHNTRTDRYGGSVENRCRVIVEIGEAIRQLVGGDMALGVRLSYDEFNAPNGITPEEADEHVALLADTRLFDYFSISGGGYHALHMSTPPMGTAEDGLFVPYAERARAIIGDRAKVFVVGKIRDLHLVEKILDSGAADAVAMGRAQLTDPHLVRKTREGREHEIIRCVGMNECIGRLFDQREVVCAMNPVTGRERMWGSGTLRLAPTRKNVVVVGGGPSGMKAAAVAASRGHDVTLLERDDELGGHVKLYARLPGQEDWAIVIDNLRRAMDNAGVEVRTGVTVTAETLRGMGAGTVLVATGAKYATSGLSPTRPDRAAIPGADAPIVRDVKAAAEALLADPGALGAKVLVLDESGARLPFAVADLAARSGSQVEILTPKPFVAEQLMRQLTASVYLPKLAEAGVRFSAQHGIEQIDGTDVTVYGVWGGPRRVEHDVTAVVMSLYRVPDDSLFRALEATGDIGDLRRIGDCLAPRSFAAVMYDGEKIGREL